MNFYINRNLTEFGNNELHDKLANESYASGIGGIATTTGTKMCTKTRGIALGCSVWNNYATNQIVQEVDLTAKVTSKEIHFNLDNLGSNVTLVLSASIPRSDFWLQKPGGGLADAGDAYWAFVDFIDTTSYPDSMYSKNYFPQDYTVEEWANSSWCGGSFICSGTTYDLWWKDINEYDWYSFVSLVNLKVYSVSDKFQFTPGVKNLNWNDCLYGNRSSD